VKGAAFDRYVSIWFENTDFETAQADRKNYSIALETMVTNSMSANFQFFAKKGITLSSLVCATHPSEPNYMAAIGG